MLIFIISYLEEKYINQFIELDKKVYAGKYTVEKETTRSRIAKNPFTDIILTKDENLVGYISLCPVDETMFKLIKNQNVTEEEIERNTLAYEKKGIYSAYLSSIVIDKENFPHVKGKFMFHYLAEHIKKMKKNGYFINKIIAVAVSKAGEKTLNKMGFKEIKKNVYIYSCKESGTEFIKINVKHALIVLLKPFVITRIYWGSV